MKRIRVVVVVFGLAMLFVFTARPQVTLAETKTFTVTNDAWVSSQFPVQNYGRATQLYVFHDSNDGMAYFNFDLSSIPAHSTITKATLIVYSMANDDLDCSGNPTTFTISLASSSWAENVITWNNRPGSAANHSNWMSCYNGWSGQDVASLVQQISDGTKTNYGFFMYGSGTNFKRTLISKESSSSHPATLEIIYTSPASSTPTASSDQTSASSSPNESSNGSSGQSSNTSVTAKQDSTAGTSQTPAASVSSNIQTANSVSEGIAGDKASIMHTNNDWFWIGLSCAALAIITGIIISIRKLIKKSSLKKLNHFNK